MSRNLKRQWAHSTLVALTCLLLAIPARAADDFFLYSNQGNGNKNELNLPTVATGSYFTAVDYFRTGANEGKMLAATGANVYMQDSVGGSSWTVVGTVSSAMDPCFIKISPSGNKVALGAGWNQDLLVFNASLLNSGSPPNLSTSGSVKSFSVNYYDAVWLNETYLIINSGDFIDEEEEYAASGVGYLDITDDENTPSEICDDIPGASSGVAIDSSGNLVFGNGYTLDSGSSLTGEVRIFAAANWLSGGVPQVGSLDYDSDGEIVGHEILSAAYLGFDNEGNLHVGGAQFLYGGSNDEAGYAALVRAEAVQNALYGTPIDEASGEDYRELAPDSCKNDTSTGILANGRQIAIMWNPTNSTCNAGGVDDYWGSGVTPKLTEYVIDVSYDMDGDGIADVSDWSPNTYYASNWDSDGDEYGNYIDADFNNDGTVDNDDISHIQTLVAAQQYEAQCDLNEDEELDSTDVSHAQALQSARPTAPYYDLTLND
jgi:hypothetical protein